MRLARCLLACLLLFAWLPGADAKSRHVRLVLSTQHDVFREFATALTSVAMHPDLHLSVQDAGGELPAASAAPDLYIAVGADAARWLQTRNDDTPVLAVLLSRAQFEALNWPAQRSVSAIFQDPPAARQLLLLKLLLPKTEIVGYLHGSDSDADLVRVRSAASALGLRLEARLADNEQNLRKALAPLVQQTQALLANASPQVYNRDTIRSILTAAYHADRVLIGSSPAFVRAGSLATTHSTPMHIAVQVREWLEQVPGRLPAPSYPRYFEVVTNPAVARSLNISLADERQLAAQIAAQLPCEKVCP